MPAIVDRPRPTQVGSLRGVIPWPLAVAIMAAGCGQGRQPRSAEGVSTVPRAGDDPARSGEAEPPPPREPAVAEGQAELSAVPGDGGDGDLAVPAYTFAVVGYGCGAIEGLALYVTIADGGTECTVTGARRITFVLDGVELRRLRTPARFEVGAEDVFVSRAIGERGGSERPVSGELVIQSARRSRGVSGSWRLVFGDGAEEGTFDASWCESEAPRMCD
jgi:hypothetical protein